MLWRSYYQFLEQLLARNNAKFGEYVDKYLRIPQKLLVPWYDSESEVSDMPTTIVVAGTRTFDDYELLSAWIDAMRGFYQDVKLVSGGSKGADALAERYASDNNIETDVFNADWNKHGKAAGPKRNKQMAEVADVLLAFWDGKSRGTANMIDEAKQRGVQTHVIRF